MSERRYFVEEPCEHGQMTQHALTRLKEDGSRWDKDGGRETWAWCPGGTRQKATPADLLAAVRRGVESGTIKGEVRQTDNHGESVWMSERPFAPGAYLVIPVSDEEDA